MSYINPLRLFRISKPEPETIYNAANRLIELLKNGSQKNGKSGLVYHNHTIDQSTILRLSQELHEQPTQRYHAFIYGYPKFNDFLESQDDRWLNHHEWPAMFADLDFREFVDPHIQYSFRKLIKRYMDEQNVEGMENLLGHVMMQKPLWKKEILNEIQPFLEEAIDACKRTIRRMHAQPGPANNPSFLENELILLREVIHPPMLNLLPWTFCESIETIVAGLRSVAQNINLSFGVSEYSLEVLELAHDIQVDRELQECVLADLDEVEAKLEEIAWRKELDQADVPEQISQKVEEGIHYIASKRTDGTYRGFQFASSILVCLIVGLLSFQSYKFLTTPQKVDQDSIVYKGNPEWKWVIKDLKQEEFVTKRNLYVGNQLDNGTIPFERCFSDPIILPHSRAFLTIDNPNKYDAVVILQDAETNEFIRQTYVQSKSKVNVMQLPANRDYKLKVFFGNNWNPLMPNFCGLHGAFQDNFKYYVSNKHFDLIDPSDSDHRDVDLTIRKKDGRSVFSSISATSFFSNYLKDTPYETRKQK